MAGKIHIATKSYLKGWAPEGLLRPVHVRYGPQKLKSPAGVGWRYQWWGDDDPELNQACEDACGPLESLIPSMLEDIEGRWPPLTEVRSVVAQFIALHILRTPAFRAWFVEAGERTSQQYVDQFSAEQYARFVRLTRTDHERSKQILRMLNKVATLVASMHWTLLCFEEAWLVTSDQPVGVFPLLDDGSRRQVVAFPPGGGLAETLELRFALSPSAALICSWHVGHHREPVAGTWSQAMNINGVVIAQADQQWFHAPTQKPALPPIVIVQPHMYDPIASDVIPGYNSATARVSLLRIAAEKEVHRLSSAGDDSTMTVIQAE
ncbi:MAG TPA: DUF4238 domain-containing protein [Baekduia sp.]|nr:DUF4238 domain-containing protein [Baekduia sp.]